MRLLMSNRYGYYVRIVRECDTHDVLVGNKPFPRGFCGILRDDLTEAEIDEYLEVLNNAEVKQCNS